MNKPETQPGGSLKSVGWAAPERGDKYLWHAGGTVTVVRVDGAMTVVMTPAGNMVKAPTGTLMTKPKAQPNTELRHGEENL